MTFGREYIFWLVAILTTVFLIGLLHEIMLPFILGTVIAYFLNPIAEKLETFGVSRFWGTFFISVIFTLVILFLLVTLIPLLYQQLVSLIQLLPDYFARVKNLTEHYGRIFIDPAFTIPEHGYENGLRQIASNFAGHSGDLFQLLWASGKMLFSFFSILLITPVVAIFLLHDWNKLVQTIENLIPRDHVETVTRLAHQVDDVVAGFMRGQVTVCLILGAFYALSLHTIGLNSGALIGLGAGIISFIPYLGASTGFIVGLGVALAQFSPDWFPIAMVGLVFIIGQVLEGNFLTPRIIGDKVSLHPVWLLFALFGFGYLFGFLGMLIAIPVAAAIGVLVRFAMHQYQKSDIYIGDSLLPETAGADTDITVNIPAASPESQSSQNQS